ncbi:homoserine O-acetyltransferase MetX [Nesterenkonia alba]|uniref:homoserine O-acetyltransferase MetX n=1 Tax=Nesterenkonia alba TaxID=515814 RepID=UPI003CCC40B7
MPATTTPPVRLPNDFGDRPAGALKTLDVGAYQFETGGELPQVTIAYETWGRLNAAGDNAVLIAHALTGDSHVAATQADPAPGWWENLVGPDRPVDPREWFVIAPAIVGGCYGSTGPASPDPEGKPWGSRFPFTTIRDSVHLEYRLAAQLGITRFRAVLGGSVGGARALEWAVTYPDMVEGVGVFACGAATTAEQIAFGQAQLQAIRNDPHFNGGDYYGGQPPEVGLGLARRIAHITYRSPGEFEARFGRKPQGSEDPFTVRHPVASGRPGGRYQVESYLDHQAAKLVRRFDANAYVTITEAHLSHDVGRDRGGVAAALQRVTATPFIAAVESDRLFYPHESDQLAGLLPGEHTTHVIRSPIGHDGFLTSPDQLGAELKSTLRL